MTLFDHISKHGKGIGLYNAQESVFDELQGVRKCDIFFQSS